MRSCCKQVKEFLDFGKHLHAEIRKIYGELNEHAELERVKMLLDYLSRHEQHMEEALARFERNARQGILNAWLEYSPTLDVDEVLRNCKLRDGMSADEIVDAAVNFDNTLIELYREVAGKVNDATVKEVFQNLLALEEKEKIQVLRAAMSLDM
jgi:rubrerythrin